MPVHAVRNAKGEVTGWQYGTTGKVYKTKAEAERQALAILISQIKQGKKPE